MKKELINKVIAVIRVRGRVNVRNDINETLDRLRIPYVNNCTVLKLTPSYAGMIQKCNNYIAFGEIDADTLKAIMKSKGIEYGDENQPVDAMLGKIKEHVPLKLHPPKRGYKSIKRGFNQKGALGYMGASINDLLKRMV
ncbi:MAG: uL30 family ribosomal protein [Candidatus Micrarchaeia archaeon]